MPSALVSLKDQLKTSDVIDQVENFVPVRLTEKHDLRVDGSSPVTRTFKQWTELDGTPNPASPVKSVSVIEITGTVADANLNNTEFLGGAALTNGIDVAIRLNGVTVIVGNIKTNQDLIDIFDEVTITSDTEATPNHTLKARLLMAEQDGIFLQLLDNTLNDEDAVLFIVNDNLSAVGVKISGNVHGFGYIKARRPPLVT